MIFNLNIDKLISENIKTFVFWAVVFTVLITIVTLWIIYKQKKDQPITGKEELIGKKGVVKKSVDKDRGLIFIEGELWEAVASGEVIKEGEKVRVLDVDGLKLKVEKIKEAD